MTVVICGGVQVGGFVIQVPPLSLTVKASTSIWLSWSSLMAQRVKDPALSLVTVARPGKFGMLWVPPKKKKEKEKTISNKHIASHKGPGHLPLRGLLCFKDLG